MSQNFDEVSLFDGLGCFVIRLDRQMNIWFMNRHGLTKLGYERLEQLRGKPLTALMSDDDPGAGELMKRLRCRAAPGDAQGGERGVQYAPRSVATLGSAEQLDADLLRHDGSRLPLSWSLSDWLDATGDERSLAAPSVLIGFDASSVRESQAAAVMFQTVSDNFRGSIVITDPQQNILYANPALLRMTGYVADEVIGSRPKMFKSGETTDEVYQSLWQTIITGGLWKGEFINRRKDGSQYLESKTISAIRDERGEVQYYFAIGEDVSQRQHYQQRIENLLFFDQLTGLPNRDAFQRALVGSLKAAQQQGKRLTVLHIDIDDFFSVNDAIGTSGADLVIVEASSRIREGLRQADQLARVGNDKFAVLLGPHDAGIDTEIRDVAERILASVGKTVLPKRAALELTASVGMAAYPEDGTDASELLTHAIAATEQAKSGGGNAFVRFDASNEGYLSARRERLHELHCALERGEMVLHFQPQVSLFSGAIVGLEALIRWIHPERGLLPPSEFIPLAEDSRHIIQLGDWVMRAACRQLSAWRDAGLPMIKVAINLAARHFLIPDLHKTIAGILSDYQIDPRFLEIEITEGTMMQDVAAAIRSTSQLKDVGVRLSLDDFGTGYSSLAYLSRFPIDVVKIDQSFVRDITSNPTNAAIAQATIAMSHKLGKNVLAEGVESEEQMLFLRRNECDEMQGFFFSRPVPAEDIVGMLRRSFVMNVTGRQNEGSRNQVLLVDDEVNILSSLKRTLRREGYDILTASSASEAFSLLATHKVQVVVSDQRMPEMNGTEFLSRVKNLYPETVRMVLSGYSEISSVTDSINKGAVYRFMLKPWDDEALRGEIAGALRHWRAQYGPKEGV